MASYCLDKQKTCQEYMSNLIRCCLSRNNELNSIAVGSISNLLGVDDAESLTKLMGRARTGIPLSILGGCQRKEIETNSLPGTDLYWSLNDFWKPKRSSQPGRLLWLRGETKHLSSVNALWVDLDYYRTPWGEKSKEQVKAAVLEALGDDMQPNIFAWSGRGAYIIYALDSIRCGELGKTEFWKQVRAWRECAFALTNRLKGWGSDTAASVSPCGVLRVPGSINSKSNQTVDYQILSDSKHSLETISGKIAKWGTLKRPVGQEIRPESGITQVRPIPDGLKHGSVAGLMKARFDDLNRILADRNERKYNWEGVRNKFCFIWSQTKLQHFAKGVGTATLDELLALNDSFANGVGRAADEWEIRCITRTRAYTLRNSRIIADLAITEDEMRRLGLKTLINKKVKLERRRGGAGARPDGRVARSASRNDAVRQAVQEGAATVDEVVVATGLSRASVYRALEALAGVIVSISRRLAVGGGPSGGGVGSSRGLVQEGPEASGTEQSQQQNDEAKTVLGNEGLPGVEAVDASQVLGENCEAKAKTLAAPVDLPSELALTVPPQTVIWCGTPGIDGFWEISSGEVVHRENTEIQSVRSRVVLPGWTVVGFDLRKGIWSPGFDRFGIKARIMDLRIAASLIDSRAAAWGWKRMAKHFLQAPSSIEELAIWQLGEFFESELKCQGLQALYEEELQVGWVLSEIETRGINVDLESLRHTSTSLHGRLDGLLTRIHQEAGERFDLSSPKVVANILYMKRGLPVLRRTAKGGPSTDSEVLKELALIDPLPGLIAEYRSLSASLDGCVIPVLDLAQEDEGRIHPLFHQGQSVNGRLSSSRPNIQGVTGAGEIGRTIREAFNAAPGHQLIGMDLSQVEIRALAEHSRDPELLRIFWDGGDVYTLLAGKVYGISPDDVSTTQRAWAKEAIIAYVYGMGPKGIAAKLRKPEAEARSFIADFQRAFPGVVRWKEQLLIQARIDGFVQLPNGTKRYVNGLLDKDWKSRFQAEREAVNSVIQGTAAIWFKKIVRCLADQSPFVKVTNLVHDEVLAEFETTMAEASVNAFQAAVGWAGKGLHVPLVAKIGIGNSWHEVHRWKRPKQ